MWFLAERINPLDIVTSTKVIMIHSFNCLYIFKYVSCYTLSKEIKKAPQSDADNIVSIKLQY